MSLASQTQHVLSAVASGARDSGLFASVEAEDTLLRAHAEQVESEAWYQVGPIEATGSQTLAWVGMHTPDRWLSGSIEADLLHRGDSFEELVEEELVNQGLSLSPKVEHFRDDDKVFVFRSSFVLPEGDEARIDLLTRALLAYESCFRELGDMIPEEE